MSPLFSRLFPALLIVGATVGLSNQAAAQRLAYCNTQYVLNKLPEYAQAKKEIERVTKEWEGEVTAALDEALALEQALEAEKVLLTPALLADRKKSVEAKRKKLDFVFDQGTAIGVLYAAETNDISDEVLQKLGGK